ncbi:MAG: hypothetical protein HRT44_05845 [Bdellovibrionales bacterium]|nr:hypothetical protein [Bdellovibrionales bacterium]NQZ18767.1 hypothetical protein [Bdellovibrionales bacterium]
MNSQRAVTAMVATVGPIMSQENIMSWSSYNHLGGGPNLRQTGDSLARRGNTPAVQRPFELGSTAPDAFDITYYSIEPTYFDNYFTTITTNGGAALQEEQRVYDFGSSKDGQENSTQDFNLMQSIQNAQTQTGGAVNDYLVNNWQHLLTSWHQERAVEFGLDSDKFGRCEVTIPDREFPTYGNCIAGGRTGYGVKNVSRDYLLRGPHDYGGYGSSGGLINPPSF